MWDRSLPTRINISVEVLYKRIKIRAIYNLLDYLSPFNFKDLLINRI